METKFWIKDVNVISMIDDNILSHRDILIKNDKIHTIVSTSNSNKSDNDIDATGKYVMPGLFDSHVHLHDNDFLSMFLANGVTAVRDTGSASSDIFKLREDVINKKIDGPMVFSSGKIIEGNPPLWSGFEVAESKPQVVQAVKRQKDAGADFIKIYHTLPADLYEEAIKQAKVHGLKVTGHVSKEINPIEALNMGLDGIEHISSLNFLTKIDYQPADEAGYEGWYKFTNCTIKSDLLEKLLNKLGSRTTYVCPTLIVHKKLAGLSDYNSLAHSESSKYMSDHYIKESWNPSHKNAAPNIKNKKPLWWHNVGVQANAIRQIIPVLYHSTTLLAGSDTPNPFVIPGFSLHEELRLLVESGLTPYQALKTATINPAKFLDIEDTLGTIEQGKLANLIILSRNPLQDIANIASIESTFVLGRAYNVNELGQRIKKHNLA